MCLCGAVIMAQYYVLVPETNGQSWRLDFQRRPPDPGIGGVTAGSGRSSPPPSRSCGNPQDFWSQVSSSYEAAFSRSLASVGLMEQRSNTNGLAIPERRPRSLSFNQESRGLCRAGAPTPIGTPRSRSPVQFDQFTFADAWNTQMFGQELKQSDFLSPTTPTSTSASFMPGQFLSTSLTDQWSPLCMCSTPCQPSSSCPTRSYMPQRPLSPSVLSASLNDQWNTMCMCSTTCDQASSCPNFSFIPQSPASPRGRHNSWSSPQKPIKIPARNPSLSSLSSVVEVGSPPVDWDQMIINQDDLGTVALVEDQPCPHRANGQGQCLCEIRRNSGASTVAIDNKIEQAMDLVKSHLMYAVREEVEVLKEQIKELLEKNSQLEYENSILKAAATPDTITELQQRTQQQQNQQQQQTQPPPSSSS